MKYKQNTIHVLNAEELSAHFKTISEQLSELKSNLQPITPPVYLTRNEVAKMFDVDLSTIHNWCKSGNLKPLGIGSRVYFLRSDIEKSLTPLN